MSEAYLVLLLFIFSCGLYLFELVWIWLGLYFYKYNELPDVDTPVTLLIAARDEEENLRKNLKYFLSQKHKSFEVLVVNDCSDDDSEFLLAEYQRKYPHLQVINLKESSVFKGGKKIAITIGIKGAQFNRIIFTDADCRPASNKWLAMMNAQFSEEKEVVLGIGDYLRTKGFLNYLIRMDTIQIAIQYMGLAARGYPYMGVGRNLAYTQDLFFESDGFKDHQKMQWGDDDLFINKVASNGNTALCYGPDSFTLSEAKSSFSSWFSQKRRHMSTAVKYKSNTKLFLAIKPLRMLLYYFILVYGMLFPELRITLLISAALIYFAHAFIFIVLKKKIGPIENHLLFPLMELILFGVNFIIYFSTWLKKPTKWT